MDIPNFTSNPGASRWITTSPGPRVIRQNTRINKKNQLLSEAASLVPDYQKLAEVLGKKKFSPAEAKWFEEQLSGMMSGYLGNYNENPFWAFTREGKDTVQQMHRHVNDPNSTLYEQLFEQSGKEKERLKNNLGLVNYNNGKINMYNKQSHKVEAVDVDDIDFQKYQPIDMNEEFSLRTNRIGFRNDPTAFTANVAEYEKVIDKIDKFLTSTGTTKQEFDNGFLSTVTSGNQFQLKKKTDLLKSGAALSDDEMNVIYARFYTDALKQGIKPRKEDANRFLLNLVDGVSKGHISMATGYGVSPRLEATRTANALNKESTEPLGPIVNATTGAYGYDNAAFAMNDEVKQRVGNIQVNKLPSQLLDYTRDKFVTQDANGVKNSQPKRNASGIQMFAATDTKNPLVLVANKNTPGYGDFIEAPDFGKLQNQVKVDDVGLVARPYKLNADGTKEYLPFNMGKILPGNVATVQGHENDAQYGAELMMKVRGQIGGINYRGAMDYFASQDAVDTEVFSLADRYGWAETMKGEQGDQFVTDYFNNVDVSEDRYKKIGKGKLTWDDDVHLYNVEYLLPINGDSNHQKAVNVDEALKGTPYGKDQTVNKSEQVYNRQATVATQQGNQNSAKPTSYTTFDKI